ncbi:hypothetical protein FVE85_9722 [Porphyridium purpureum]|uniref:Uncharacterized protein n=1 Tax=Porphyridium purpureum TaxID=35688 RepID=A0A5J4YKM6_PORPP|nr:hypothetical protein FVE85_9722 [Porphyridium purpureum]|eukprot:POR5273..scf246_12
MWRFAARTGRRFGAPIGDEPSGHRELKYGAPTGRRRAHREDLEFLVTYSPTQMTTTSAAPGELQQHVDRMAFQATSIRCAVVSGPFVLELRTAANE